MSNAPIAGVNSSLPNSISINNREKLFSYSSGFMCFVSSQYPGAIAQGRAGKYSMWINVEQFPRKTSFSSLAIGEEFPPLNF